MKKIFPSFRSFVTFSLPVVLLAISIATPAGAQDSAEIKAKKNGIVCINRARKNSGTLTFRSSGVCPPPSVPYKLENGATGATGVAGADGAVGATGVAGATGAIGPVGETGAAGSIGNTGVAGPTGPVGPTGDIGLTGATGAIGATGVGSAGATGATGPVGATGTAAIGEYAYIYNLGAQVVAINSDVVLDTNGILSSGFSHTTGTASIIANTAGTYKISFTVTGVEPNQFALFLNGAVIPGSIYGSGAGTQQNRGVVIADIASGDVITLRNHTSVAAVTLQRLAGGTSVNANASILIEQLE